MTLRLGSLNADVLLQIIDELPGDSLQSFSSTSRFLRQISMPNLFSRVQVLPRFMNAQMRGFVPATLRPYVR